MQNRKKNRFFVSWSLAFALIFPPFTNFGPVFGSFETNDNLNPINTAQRKLDAVFDNQILVKLKPEKQGNAENLVSKYKALSSERHFSSVSAIKFDGSVNLWDKLEQLRNDPEVEFAEPNYKAYAFFVPNDPYFNSQWALGVNLNMPKVWELATGQGAVVAVVDTGIAYEDYKGFKKAPDLALTRFVPGYNFVSSTTHANDDNGHGTHVTGTIAQSTNNALGTAGVAYNASIMPIKVLDAQGAGNYADIADALIWAADSGANIINMSLGGPSPSEALRQALSYAKSKGVLIVAASGNDGASVVSYPAAYNDYVLAVGATRFDEAITKYSNQGTALDIVAPGGDMKVDQNGDGYGDGILQQTFTSNKPSSFGYYFFQGTSMATPHVAGVAALLVEKGIKDPNKLQNILQSTADDKGLAGRDNTYGFGAVNPLKALTYLDSSGLNQSPNNPPPIVAPTPTPTPVPSQPVLAKTLHVSDLNLRLQGTFLRKEAVATVTVHDANNQPVSGVKVSGTWSGLVSLNKTVTTNSSGVAVFYSGSVRKAWGQFTLVITNLVKDGYEYKPENNNKTSETINVSRALGF